VLYHHGFPHRRELALLTAAGREWLAQLPLPAVAREQIAVALRMSNALDTQLPAIDKELAVGQLEKDRAAATIAKTPVQIRFPGDQRGGW
jgi:hypothetical protein